MFWKGCGVVLWCCGGDAVVAANGDASLVIGIMVLVGEGEVDEDIFAVPGMRGKKNGLFCTSFGKINCVGWPESLV